ERISATRLLKETGIALLWAACFAAVVFPPFYFGYRYFWHVRHHFTFRAPGSLLDDVAGQIFVIALPEEAFFRGYLQTALDASWTRKVRVLGADLGPGWLVSAAIFAVG